MRLPLGTAAPTLNFNLTAIDPDRNGDLFVMASNLVELRRDSYLWTYLVVAY
ncbi:MAG: hypothetical protein LH613_04795 [Chamaesiphon sp.]|nr:hypothetical protein [Chamaesiphon sp.]